MALALQYLRRLRVVAASESSVTVADKMDMSLDDIIQMHRSQCQTTRGRGRGAVYDLSLDDIIQMNRSQYQTTRGRGRGSGGLAGRGAPRGFGAGSGAIRGGALRGCVRQQPYPEQSFAVPEELHDRWQRDMYEGVDLRRTLTGGPGGAAMGPYKLLISNLDNGVSDADIQGLFAEFGPVSKASVHYDHSGSSLGTADVVFERRSDAVRAMKQCNGVPLDGRPMNIQLVTPALPPAVLSTAAGLRYAATGGGRGGGGVVTSQRPRGDLRGRGRGRGGRGGTVQRKVPTAEELNAELDAYFNRME